ncbi:MAG: leucine-rich repeat protein [Lachnospiraceae bacterium]|nr:leucine-rich repeat protein [Lachnospiraceae bacterium]
MKRKLAWILTAVLLITSPAEMAWASEARDVILMSEEASAPEETSSGEGVLKAESDDSVLIESIETESEQTETAAEESAFEQIETEAIESESDQTEMALEEKGSEQTEDIAEENESGHAGSAEEEGETEASEMELAEDESKQTESASDETAETVIENESETENADDLIMAIDVEDTEDVPMAAATVTGTSGDVTWSYSSTNKRLTISGTGAMANYTSSTSMPWYDYIDSITSVVISSGVTSIGSRAFYDCSNLTSVSIASSVTAIRNYAFYNCSSLTSVKIPSSVTSIGYYVFYNCTGLSSVTISSGVTSIGYYAFGYCTGLTSVTIPSSVTSISGYAFAHCTGLTSVTIPSSVTSILGYAFYYCSSLKSVSIPSSITSIGISTFSNCSSLTSVSIPSSVTTIGDSAFSSCSSLTSVSIPSSVTTIGDYAFRYCESLTSVTIPSSVTSVGEGAFYYCIGMESVSIPSSLTTIGIDVFGYCKSLTSVTIPSSVTTIGNYAFRCTGLTSLDIPTSVTAIGTYAFAGCTGLTSVTIPSSLKGLSSFTFSGCTHLTSVTIPSSITTIGTYAFYNCTGLKTITIPSGVTAIMDYAFYNCSALTTVYYGGTSSDWSSISIGSTENTYLTDATIYCAHTVTLNANGGSVSGVLTTSIIATYGLTYGAWNSLPTPTRTGYTFSGWYTSSSSGTKKTDSSTVSKNYAHTLYAHWTANTYTVTFNANGGSTSTSSKTVTYASTYGTLPDSTRTGYTFSGWYTAASGGSEVTEDSTVSITAAQTLYAHWTVNTYTVTFNANGGSTSTSSKTVTYASTYGSLPEPTRTGYTFSGWYTAASGGSQVTASTTVSITAAQTLYAHWTAKTYTVTFNANGGSTLTTSTTVTYASTYGTLPTPTRTGYTCSGWYTAASGGSQVTASTTVSITAAQTLYAHWTAQTYTVSFNANGGSTSTSSKTVTYAGSYGTLPTPTRTGYTFTGWFTAAGGGSQVTGSTTVSITSAQTLYAHWSKNSYVVTFDANGGSVSTETATVIYASTYGTLPTPARDGYSFLGWYTSSSSGTQVTEGTTVQTAGNHSLYAHWIEQTETQTITVSSATKNATIKQAYVKNGTFSLGASAQGGLTYTSSNNKIATVSSGGEVTMKGYGTVKITITAAPSGEYKQTSTTITLTVKPKKMKISSVKSTASGVVKITWKKDSKASGYQLQCSSTKKFTAKTTTTGKCKKSKTKLTLSNMSFLKGKKVYVRIRAYKTVNGKKVYGAWSKVKSVTVK